MDFRHYVRDRLPPLALQREPEILDELAQHLADLYEEGRSAGLDHQTALDRAVAALSDYPDNLAREIQSASRALPRADRRPLARHPRRAIFFSRILRHAF